VAVIGAGPAGTSTAYELEKSGYSVLLVDKEDFPRQKPCAGVLPPRIYSELEIPDSLMERPLEGYRLFSSSGVMLESRFPKNGLIVRREKFDNFLAQRLKTRMTKARISDCIVEKDHIRIKGEGVSFQAKFAVGADGANSQVRKIFGLDDIDISKDMAIAMQYEISIPSQEIEKRIGNWFEVYYTIPYGYGWISPLEDVVKVGIGGVSDEFETKPKKMLEKFIKQAPIEEKIRNGKIEKQESHLIPIIGPFNKLTAHRTILVGDAGGFVFPGTGEGIYYAIKSGRIAAEVINQAFDEDNFESDFLEKSYSEKLEKNGLFSLKEVDFVKKVLSSPEKAESYIKRLKKLKIV
jgi:geranylgeranyl reductase family protein